jgi:transketolase
VIERVHRPHARNMVEYAATRPDVLVCSADLTSSCEADDFREAYPDRFLSFGVAEQNMMGFAAGLAREGFVPFVHTFAVFICRRPFDQVAMSIAYPNLRVRLLGFLPGITTPGGVTHQAIDDIALMRVLPNMTIFSCGDATDVQSALACCDEVDGPVYVRMLRGEVPRLFDAGSPTRLGSARLLRPGDDITLLSEGICTQEAMRATDALANHGVSIRHLHVTTLKPLRDPAVLEAIHASRTGVVTMENHSIVGGLGSAVAEVMAEGAAGKPLRRIGLRDRYAHGASSDYLMQKYGLDAMALVREVEDLVGARLGVEEADLAQSGVTPTPSTGKAEDL